MEVDDNTDITEPNSESNIPYTSYIKLFYTKLKDMGYRNKIKTFYEEFQQFNNEKYNIFFDLLSKSISESNMLNANEKNIMSNIQKNPDSNEQFNELIDGNIDINMLELEEKLLE